MRLMKGCPRLMPPGRRHPKARGISLRQPHQLLQPGAGFAVPEPPADDDQPVLVDAGGEREQRVGGLDVDGDRVDRIQL